jgi:hypothetical protein
MSTPPDTDGFEQSRTPHEEFAESTVHDRELSQNNFGAGVYKSAEVYEQTRRFKRTLNANAGVGQAIERLARGEVFQTIGQQGWKVQVDDDTRVFPAFEDAEGTDYEEQAKRARAQASDAHDVELEYGRQVFGTLPDYLQTHAITELSSLDERFDPPEMRITKFFHEATRSKGGRLMDNVFGRVKKRILEGMNESSKKSRSLFGGGD